MFHLGITELKSMQQRLEAQLEKCRGNRDRFREAYSRMVKSSQELFEKRTSQFQYVFIIVIIIAFLFY